MQKKQKTQEENNVIAISISYIAYVFKNRNPKPPKKPK